MITRPEHLTPERRESLAAIRQQLTIARTMRGHLLSETAAALGVTRPYLSRCLHGYYVSDRLMEKVRAYIEQTPGY